MSSMRGFALAALLLLAAIQGADATVAAAAATKVVPGAGCPNITAGVLAMHNRLRWQHNVPPLQWDTALAAKAQAHANMCKWGHSNGGSLYPNGESIYSSSGTRYPFRGMDVCSWATYALYLEVTTYNFNLPGQTRDPLVQIGHFVNIVWTDTTKLGCGYSACGGKMDYVVCWYGPGFYASGGSEAGTVQYASKVRRTDCQSATGDDWCSACDGATCQRCFERPAYGQPMGQYKIELDPATNKCASACPPGIKIKNCARCTFNNLCLACKAGWRLDAQGWCVRGKRQKQRRR